MHVRRLTIRNIRSIRKFELFLPSKKNRAGWHVILGNNGSGKSTVVRSLALALMGEANAHATREDWSNWLSAGRSTGSVRVSLRAHDADRWTGRGKTAPEESIVARATFFGARAGASRSNRQRPKIQFPIDAKLEKRAERTVWGDGLGWFSASFGAFRRFSGGDPKEDRLYSSRPRLGCHLSAFGEKYALSESLEWFRDVHIAKLEKRPAAEKTENAVVSFINGADLLPHGARIESVTSDGVTIRDGRGSLVGIEEMSDGYRSILSLTLEIMRLLFSAYGPETALAGIDTEAGRITLPGVVAIDEIDAHLHPEWQARIGEWFVERFPNMQFFVTTHSPIVCRAAARGSVWLLPDPGSDDEPRRVTGVELDRLIHGSILDAYGTELFGEDSIRSKRSEEMLERLARLNRKRLRADLSSDEQQEIVRLRAALPSTPNETAAE